MNHHPLLLGGTLYVPKSCVVPSQSCPEKDINHQVNYDVDAQTSFELSK